MKSKKITIYSITDIEKFCDMADDVDGAGVVVRQGSNAIDGASIMGWATISEANVTVDYPEDAEEFEEYLNTLDTWE